MNEKTPYNLVKTAFENKELNKLLLGENPYKYMTRFYSGAGDSDVPALIYSGIIPYIEKNKTEEVIDYFINTLNELCLQYDGLFPVVALISCCTTYKEDHGIMPANINFEKLSDEIKKSIQRHKFRLEKDFTGNGSNNEKGRYGDLKRLSKIITENDGPNFFPEENKQNEGVKL